MEPRAGALYDRDPARFEEVARQWTWRYAMTDTLAPQPLPEELTLVRQIALSRTAPTGGRRS